MLYIFFMENSLFLFPNVALMVLITSHCSYFFNLSKPYPIFLSLTIPVIFSSITFSAYFNISVSPQDSVFSSLLFFLALYSLQALIYSHHIFFFTFSHIPLKMPACQTSPTEHCNLSQI